MKSTKKQNIKKKSVSKNTHKKSTRAQQQKKAHRIAIISVLGIVLIGSLLYIGITRQQAKSDAASYAGCNFKINKKINKRVVDGFFFFTSNNNCLNRSQLQQAHQLGATTAFTFGARLTPTSKAGLSQGNFKDFKINKKPAYNHIARMTDGGKIRKIFTYSNKESYTSLSLACGKRDGVVVQNNKMYTWWLFPINKGYSDCTDSKKQYDLVVSYNQDARRDGNSNMVENAKLYGMDVYLGLPNPNTDNKLNYLASRDKNDRHTLGAFTTRVVKTWAQRHANANNLKGTYLTLESAIGGKPSIWNGNYKVYEMQSQIIGWNMPAKKRQVALSPYVTGSLKGSATSMRTMVEAAKKGSGVKLILMPQDGAGTGRIGKTSTIQTLYTEARKAGAWQTWANLEAFKPGGKAGNRQPMPSNAKRFKQQMSYAKKAKVNRVIVYDWNHFTQSGAAKRF